MADALITPPLPEELWFRIREVQTKNLSCEVLVNFKEGKVQSWTISIEELPASGRQDIRLQTSKKGQRVPPPACSKPRDSDTNIYKK